MTTKTLDLNDIERKLFWIFASLIGFCLAVYLYSVLSLTVAGVERDQMSRTSHDLASQIGDLESEYMKIQNSITLARAKEIGFHEVTAKFTNLHALNDTNITLSMAR